MRENVNSLRKIIFLICFLLNLMCLSQERGFRPVEKVNSSYEELYEEIHALIIGNSSYKENWPALPGVAEDVSIISSTLKKIGFNVVQAQDLNKYQLDSAFTQFISNYGTNPNAGLLFYFAGHGHTIQTNYGEKLGYIVPLGANNPNLSTMDFQSNAIEMAQMEIYAKRIESKHALFIFDACFSGSVFSLNRAIPEVISYKTKQPVRQFISSGTENEKVSDESIFRKQFIEALTTSHADYDKDGFLTGTELGRYLQSTVISYSNNTQHPQYGKISNPSLNKGDFVFGLKPGKSNVIKMNENRLDSSSHHLSGSIELSTEIGGDLYVDGKLLASVTPNTIVPILDLSIGPHLLEIKGSEKWEDEVIITSNSHLVIQVKSQVKNDLLNQFINMVFVSGGKFKMGSIYGESDEQPTHQVTLNDYEISSTEVTVGQFSTFVSETGYKTDAEEEGWSWVFDEEWKKKIGYTWKLNSKGEPAADYEPVRYVSWRDCMKFTTWVSEKMGGKFRLPTEAEWEYAARGGIHQSDFKFSGSEVATSIGWFKSNSEGGVQRVGIQQANELNLYDMSGNVWEWCSDWYHARYYEYSSYANPKGPSSGEFRVLRGGSWDNSVESGRVTNRHKYRPLDRDNLTGFRVVREIF